MRFEGITSCIGVSKSIDLRNGNKSAHTILVIINTSVYLVLFTLIVRGFLVSQLVPFFCICLFLFFILLGNGFTLSPFMTPTILMLDLSPLAAVTL